MIFDCTLICGCGIELSITFDNEYLYQMPIKVISPCKLHKEKPLEQVFRAGRGEGKMLTLRFINTELEGVEKHETR